MVIEMCLITDAWIHKGIKYIHDQCDAGNKKGGGIGPKEKDHQDAVAVGKAGGAGEGPATESLQILWCATPLQYQLCNTRLVIYPMLLQNHQPVEAFHGLRDFFEIFQNFM